MAKIDKQYRELALKILGEGFEYSDPSRNNVSLIQIPHYQLEIDMNDSFPLLTTKKIYWKGVLHELFWFLSGSTDIKYLQENGVHIWDQDAYNFSQGTEVGRIYGAQWRDWGIENRTDQIARLLGELEHYTFNRRHLVTAWNPEELQNMALPPCHWSFEVIPFKKDGEINFVLKWHQRSVDTFLGLPFDIASYAFLGKMLEAWTGFKFDRLIGDLSNVHFYTPHIPQVYKQLMRSEYLTGPEVKVKEIPDLYGKSFSLDLFEVNNYNPLGALRGELFTQTSKHANL